MPDYGSKVADRAIRNVELELRTTYSTARKELREKLKDFNEKHKVKNAYKRQQLADGKITKQEYKEWLTGQVFMRTQWENKIKQVNRIMLSSNRQAMNIINSRRLDVFAENYNYNSFRAEKLFRGQNGLGISFDLYNTQSVARLIADDPEILPEWKINEEKDYEWNYKKVNNIVKQGIIQGESVADIMTRLCEDLSTMNESKMRMFARTAITGAQNAGRQQQMNDAAEMGINVHKQWLATLDGRTRDSHREMDGEEVDYKEDFSNGLEYPGDPAGHPAEVYNCRCTMVTIYPEYEDRRKANWREEEEIDGESYEEWKEHKHIEEQSEDVREVVEGKDITATWSRRQNEYDFEIEDVLAAQGYDGLPHIVDRAAFDEAVRESGFIAQRSYTAPDKATLEAYRNMLYNGHFHVDCSTGGAQYGQGMYCAADYSGKLTQGIKTEMEHYLGLGFTRGNKYGFTETMTLAKDAKIISYKELQDIRIGALSMNYRNTMIEKLVKGHKLSKDEETFVKYNLGTGVSWEEVDTAARKLSSEKISELMGTVQKIGAEATKLWNDEHDRRVEKAHEYQQKFRDVGSMAAALGYDAINAEGHGQSGSYTIVLNRTKLIILEGDDSINLEAMKP